MPRQRYRVVGEYAQFLTTTASGRMLVGFHKGAPVPPDATPEAIRHHLSVGLIAPVGGVQAPPPATIDPVAAAQARIAALEAELARATAALEAERRRTPPPASAPADEPTTPATADAADEDRWAQARAKLPADGSMPKKTHGQAVWVEYLVARGYDRPALEQATKEELITLAESAA